MNLNLNTRELIGSGLILVLLIFNIISCSKNSAYDDVKTIVKKQSKSIDSCVAIQKQNVNEVHSAINYFQTKDEMYKNSIDTLVTSITNVSKMSANTAYNIEKMRSKLNKVSVTLPKPE